MELSTIEVEYGACCLAAQEVTWLRSCLQDLNLIPRVNGPVKMLYDDTNPKFHRNTIHIKRCYEFKWATLKIVETLIKYISSNKMIVDMLVKLTIEMLSKLK